LVDVWSVIPVSASLAQTTPICANFRQLAPRRNTKKMRKLTDKRGQLRAVGVEEIGNLEVGEEYI
jgi:hypothetical protein